MPKTILGELLVPTQHYLKSADKEEILTEVVLPLMLAIFFTYICNERGSILPIVDTLSGNILSVASILIGFTAMVLTLLLTTNLATELKELFWHRSDGSKSSLTLFQILLNRLMLTLILEITLLFLALLYIFLGLQTNLDYANGYGMIFFFFFSWMSFSILFFILITMTWAYFSFYSKDENKKQKKEDSG